MYTFKARCLQSTQSADGLHVATFAAETGEVVIPSKDLLFEAGQEYSFSVDGKLKNAKPVPVTAPVPPVAPPAPQPAPPPAPAPAPKP